MIVKERNAQEHDDTSVMAVAGAKAEAQMAHYLQRAFGDDATVRVFHDLRLPTDDGGDAAQIDHLVLYRGGFALIESKSVTSAVRINQEDQWSRLWNRNWQGMPSPVQQLKRQAEFLRKLLRAEATTLRRKALFGLLQQGFGNVPFDQVVAISDTGLVERAAGSQLPVLKADQVVDRVRERMAYRDVNFLTFTNRKDPEGDDAPWVRFEPDEMERIAAFLLARHSPLKRGVGVPLVVHPVPEEPVLEPQPPAVTTPLPTDIPRCRHCQSTSVEVRYGRNYYLACTACAGNTPIQLTCAGCGGVVRIRKEGAVFHRECKACGSSVVYHRNPMT